MFHVSSFRDKSVTGTSHYTAGLFQKDIERWELGTQNRSAERKRGCFISPGHSHGAAVLNLLQFSPLLIWQVKWTLYSYIFRGLIDVSAKAHSWIPGTMIPGSRTKAQPQRERTSVVKSRWGLKVPYIKVWYICGKFSSGKWLVWMLILVNHGVYTHLSYIHFAFVRFPTVNCQILSGWNPNIAEDRFMVLCQVLPVSDHYLVSYFNSVYRWLIFHIKPRSSFETQIWSFVISFVSSKAPFCLLLKVQILLLSGFLSCKLNLHKWLFFLYTQQSGRSCYWPPCSFREKLLSFLCGCWRAAAQGREPSPQQSHWSGVRTWPKWVFSEVNMHRHNEQMGKEQRLNIILDLRIQPWVKSLLDLQDR